MGVTVQYPVLTVAALVRHLQAHTGLQVAKRSVASARVAAKSGVPTAMGEVIGQCVVSPNLHAYRSVDYPIRNHRLLCLRIKGVSLVRLEIYMYANPAYLTAR